MNRSSATLASQCVAVAMWAARHADVKHIRVALPTGKRLQRTVIHVFIPFLVVCFGHAAHAITLEQVLQTTLEKNPAIQEAKSGLEQAAGQRLVFRSVVWPDAELGAPAGVQAGHRAGESGVKGFFVGRGWLTQTLFNMVVPPSLRRGDIEVLIAKQQLNVAVVQQLHAARLAF